MILVKWVIACLHARCSVMPQEVKIPGRNKKELSVRSFEINNTMCDHINRHAISSWVFTLSLRCLPPSAQAPGNIVVEFKTFAAEIAKLNIFFIHFINDIFFWTRRLRLCCHQSKLFITAGVVVNVSSVQRRQQWTRTAGLELGSETNRWKDRSANYDQKLCNN